ncbi:MAG: glycosyltransferase [Bacteroidetes bacterium]|nr:MAG: glycosyltransferase [Bacteroidota bacterium]
MSTIPTIVSITCLILTVAYVGPLIWAGIGFRKLFESTLDMPDGPTNEFVSVVIAARNEESNIEACLSSICKSDYPSEFFEIIIVDDDSTDETVTVVRRFAQEFKGEISIRVYSSPDPPSTGQKKAALGYGIGRASGNILLLTDADCHVSRTWMSSMISSFRTDTGLVAGPVQFDYDASAWSRGLALEFMGLTALAAGSFGQGRPYSCSGASIGFRRDAYEEVGGYGGLEHLSSGDDEMLMHRIARTANWQVAYCRVPSAVVNTRPPLSLRGLLQQRRRWASKSIHYEHWSLRAGVVGGLLFMSAIIALFTAGFYNSLYWIILSLMISLKMIAEMKLLFPSARVFGRRELLRYHILVQPFHVLYVVWAGLAGLFGGFEWKGRKLVR